MWWQPDLDPLPGYGVTTVVMGNCGFALAPLPEDPAARAEVVKIFSFFEDIPERPFFENLPWDWMSWSEYKASLTRRVAVPTHYASFVGHIAIRLAAMGMDAWQRAATPDEIARMARDLEDALAAGALGLSTNLMDHDGSDRPVPTLLAADEELRALFEVLARHRGATLQVVIDTVMRMTAVEALGRVERLIGSLPIRLQWAGLPTLRWQKEHGIQKPLLEMHERYAREGRDFWTGYAHVPVTTVVSFDRSLLFAQSNEYVWHEVVTAVGADAKCALLRSPEWRARARHSWDELALPTCPFRRPRPMLLDHSENGAGPVGVRLGDYADAKGLHPSDALAGVAARERRRVDGDGARLGSRRRDGLAAAEGPTLGRQHQRRRGPWSDVLRGRRQHRAPDPVRARDRRADDRAGGARPDRQARPLLRLRRPRRDRAGQARRPHGLLAGRGRAATEAEGPRRPRWGRGDDLALDSGRGAGPADARGRGGHLRGRPRDRGPPGNDAGARPGGVTAFSWTVVRF
jgi:hypothetical protein